MAKTDSNSNSSVELIADVTGVILCGGSSSRMGEDKVLVNFQGKPLIEHTLAAARAVFKKIMISVRNEGYCSNLGYPAVFDQLEITSPVSGIHAALKKIEKGRLLVLAVDMPLAKPELLRMLVNYSPESDVVIPRVQGFFEPLMAVYSTRCIPMIEESIKQGKRRVIGFFPKAQVCIVEQPELEKIDPKLRSFINVNSKAGLKAAETLARILHNESPSPDISSSNGD